VVALAGLATQADLDERLEFGRGLLVRGLASYLPEG
jgi:hypothetical protein